MTFPIFLLQSRCTWTRRKQSFSSNLRVAVARVSRALSACRAICKDFLLWVVVLVTLKLKAALYFLHCRHNLGEPGKVIPQCAYVEDWRERLLKKGKFPSFSGPATLQILQKSQMDKYKYYINCVLTYDLKSCIWQKCSCTLMCIVWGEEIPQHKGIRASVDYRMGICMPSLQTLKFRHLGA